MAISAGVQQCFVGQVGLAGTFQLFGIPCGTSRVQRKGTHLPGYHNRAGGRAEVEDAGVSAAAQAAELEEHGAILGRVLPHQQRACRRREQHL